MKLVNKLKIVFLILVTLASCGVPKDVINRINSSSKEMKEFPIDYYLKFPKQTFENWDKDYNSYRKFLTPEIMRTQIGLSSKENNVNTWWCYPCAQTHIQLDTTSMIKNTKLIEGDWRIISNRKISFIDSVDVSNKKFYRSDNVIYDEKGADLFVNFSDSKMKLYGNETDNKKYKLGFSKNYKIINGRFLMLYGATKDNGGISQIGIDKDGQLIINSYWVQERKSENEYMTFESVVTQTIYRKQ
mgnify:CR=1 FL=1